ncbi:unnamed protein product, partial [Rotaria magnacalcarata]
ERALLLAETDVTKAMDLIRKAMPMEFMAHSSWFVIFPYLNFYTYQPSKQ